LNRPSTIQPTYAACISVLLNVMSLNATSEVGGLQVCAKFMELMKQKKLPMYSFLPTYFHVTVYIHGACMYLCRYAYLSVSLLSKNRIHKNRKYFRLCYKAILRCFIGITFYNGFNIAAHYLQSVCGYNSR
jgi:hypothetical protein